MSAKPNLAERERAELIQHSAAQLIRMVLQLAQYAAGDPREEVRRDAERRLDAALEAILGMDRRTVAQIATVYLIKTAAETGGNATAVVAENPTLAGHEEKIGAAIEGWRDADRRWPPLVALLEASGALTVQGGNPKGLKASRRRAADSLHAKWRKYEKRGVPSVFQPPGYRPATPLVDELPRDSLNHGCFVNHRSS